jgi:Flp pilus assembly protein TadG
MKVHEIHSRDRDHRPTHRAGTALPLLTVCLVALLGFLALAIDLGMLALSKVQAQNAADLAALAGARALDATAPDYGQSQATTTAQNILTYNVILGQKIQSSQLTLTYGTYDYSQSNQTFGTNFPGTPNVPTSAVAATVVSNPSPTAFSGVFGWSALPTVTAQATAVHRPRDVALVMDLSNSMRFGTTLGFEWCTTSRTTNNPDTVVPTFGQYSAPNVQSELIGPTTNRISASYTITPTNTTATNSYYSKTYINSFYQQDAYAVPIVRAFDSYSSADGGYTWSPPTTQMPQLPGVISPPGSTYTVTPGGDCPLFKQNSNSVYAQNVKDVVGGNTFTLAWELDGYSNYTTGSLNGTTLDGKPAPVYKGAANDTASVSGGTQFNGYTQGPGYWGKTFFVWPPDPRQPLGTSTTSTCNTTIQTWLQQIGYQNSAGGLGYTNSATTAAAIQGIYSTANGGQAWPWPAGDDGTGTAVGTLSNYLLNKVKDTDGVTALTTNNVTFCRIMRLYGWNYVVDNQGTTPCDWRVRFFGTNDNSKLFAKTASLGQGQSWGLNNPTGNYTINYNEILRWITQTPNPFPKQMRAGRIKYYGSIPSAITGAWPNYGSTDERFWKEFIDYCLGFYQNGTNSYQNVSAMSGYGSDDTSWAGVKVKAPPSSGVNAKSMPYDDSPPRGLLRYWFSPINMVDYLHNDNFDTVYQYYNPTRWFPQTPGDGYEAPLYPGKQAFLGAITTMQTNHPNDWFTTVFYGWPREHATGNHYSSFASWNCVNCPLGTNYSYAQKAMFFPFSTINADGSDNFTEVTPYDSDPATGTVPSACFLDIARGSGATTFDMALMLCYNQFVATPQDDTALRKYVTQTPIQFPTGLAGGMGRKGAQKVIIFETDGVANTMAGMNGNANAPAASGMTSAAAYQPPRYYAIRYDMNNPAGSEYPTINDVGNGAGPVQNNIKAYITQLKGDFGTQRNPFRLYTLGFGPVFDPTSPDYNIATTVLQNMQYWAGTQGSPNTPLDPSQLITGTDATMQSNMTKTYTNILQNGIQIALVK